MSGNKQGRDNRRSPVGNRKTKTPRAGKTNQVSNGLQEIIPNSVQTRGRSASLGKEEVHKMNLMTVRKLDTSVVRIESTVPQVVLYQYESDSNTWERTSVEGTLFIYERSSSPKFGFVVLNKLHSGNSIECIFPGMEFRVQEPFVLFKKQESVSKIYGLCFQELRICKTVGNLLNRLSSVTQPSTKEQNSVRSGPSLIPRRSASALTISDTKSEQQPPKVDVLDMLETASRSYLGQTFSDGTGSPDSLTSEPISFATDRNTAGPSSTMERKDSTHFTNHTHHTSTTTSRHPEMKGRTNSIQEVPGVKLTTNSRAVSLSPKKRTRSPVQSSQASTQRGRMHHAASFDFGHSELSSRQNVSVSPQFTHFSRSFDDNGIVKKLFGQTGGSSSSTHTDVRSSLSQSLNIQPSVTLAGSVPLRAISLDEVEKQMAAEVVSPDSNIPFSLLNTTTSSSVTFQSHSIPEQPHQNVLVQPSMFSPAGLFQNAAQPQPVAISVNPPTPMTNQSFPQAKPALLPTPLPENTSTPNQSFPSIPPLMHSAGMKASPITSGSSVNTDTPKRSPSGGSVFHTPSNVGQIPQRASSEPAFSNMHNGTPVRPPVSARTPLSPLPELLIPQNRTTSPVPVSSTLMSPQQFTHEQTESDKLIRSSGTVHTTNSVDGIDTTVGLSRDQLLQAFNYLLTHDDHFIDQLHSAYKQSLLSKQ